MFQKKKKKTLNERIETNLKSTMKYYIVIKTTAY